MLEKQKRILKTVIHWVIAIAIIYIALQFGYRYCLAKREFMIDESLTYALANNQSDGWCTYWLHGWFGNDTWLNSYTIQYPEHAYNWAQVIKNQTWDVHPPLYYMVLHAISSYHMGELSIWFGLEINIICYAICCFLIHYIVYHETKSELLSIATVGLYAFHPNILYGLQMIRMYQMVTVFVLLFVASGLAIIRSDKKLTWYAYVPLILSVIGGGLTHYFFYYAALILSLGFGVVLIARKKWIDLSAAIVTVAGSAALNIFVLFNGTLEHLFSAESNGQHGTYALSALSKHQLDVKRFLHYTRLSFGGKNFVIMIAVLAVLGIAYAIYKKNWKRVSSGLVLSVGYLLNLLVVSQTATFEVFRYLIPTEAIGMIGFGFLVHAMLSNQYTKYLTWFPTLIFAIMLADVSMIQENEAVIPGWEYAKQHKDNYLMVVHDDRADFDINTSFLSLSEYCLTGITDMHDDLQNVIEYDFILYVDKELDQNEVIDYVTENYASNYSGDHVLTVEAEPDVYETFFDVYYVHVD